MTNGLTRDGETTSIQRSMNTARNHWIIFFNPIASSHGLVFFFIRFTYSKPATDALTWVLPGFYPEKDGELTDPCMLDEGHTVHDAGSLTSAWHRCSQCCPTGGVAGD